MRMTLDHEYCLRSDTRVLGVAGEVNGRKITFNGLEVSEATTYKIKFGLPDKTSFEGTISDGEYTVPADVVAQAGKVQVQIIAANGNSMIRKSQILMMIVVDSIDYEPPENSYSPALGIQTLDFEGATYSNVGAATGVGLTLNRELEGDTGYDVEEQEER